MKLYSIVRTTLLPVFALMFITSCDKDLPGDNNKNNQALASQSNTSSLQERTGTDLVQSVKKATSRFHSTTQAIKAGYIPDNHCVSVPGLGGMGYHWANPGLVDPVFDPLKPEVMLYAKGADGELRLVAVEYIVINVGQPRPSFGDKLFDMGGTPIPAPHWTLHVWLFEENPTGMFKPFNPNITCL